ncbi:MAG: HD-GYP domain-containing protein (c-di-GMP phosphodiesterase class II), partial [Porticoccaceae bacterium]
MLYQEEPKHLGQTSRLHNLGKMGNPNSILQKPVKLVEDEFQIMCT